MSLFRLSNDIFKCELNAQELSVYAYMCSLPASGSTLQGAAVVSVKQRTIAANCRIKSPVTIAKTIDRLCKRGWSIFWNATRKPTGITGHTAMRLQSSRRIPAFSRLTVMSLECLSLVRCSCICSSASHSAQFCRIAGTAIMTLLPRSE